MPDALVPTDPSLPALYTLEAVSGSVAQIEQVMGGRGRIIEALLNAPPSPAYQSLIAIVADPGNDRRSLASLCAEAQFTIGELIEVYKKGRMALATVESINVVADHTVAVVEDVMVRAAPHLVTCGECGGTSSVTDPEKPDAPPEPCESCRGTGTRTILPDLDRQKYALDLAGLGPKKVPQTLVTVDNRKVNLRDASRANMDRILHAADAVLRGQSVVIEAEPVEVPTDEPPAPPADTSDTVDNPPVDT